MLFLLLFLVFQFTSARIYFISKEGHVAISGAEYKLHNSNLKLECLAAAYHRKTFEANMLDLSEATMVELSELPIDKFWSNLGQSDAIHLLRNADLTSLMNELELQKKLSILTPLLKATLSAGSLRPNLELLQLNDYSFKHFFQKILPTCVDPIQFVLQYSPALSERISLLLGLSSEDQPIYLLNVFLADYQPYDNQAWTEFRNFFLDLLKHAQKSGFESPFELWNYFEENCRVNYESMWMTKKFLVDIINSIDYTNLDRKALIQILHLYNSPEGLIFALDMYDQKTQLQEFVEHQLDLMDVELWDAIGPVVFNGVGETIMLMGSGHTSSGSLTFVPSNREEFMEAFESGHLATGWVKKVALNSEWIQEGLFWALTWNPQQPTNFILVQELVDSLDSLKPEYLPILTILSHLLKNPGDIRKLNISRISPRRKTERLILELLFDKFGIQSTAEVKECKKDIKENLDYSTLLEMEAADFVSAIKKHGFSKIYNELSPEQRRIMLQRLTPEIARQISGFIHLEDMQDDLVITFLDSFMTKIDIPLFWGSMTREAIEKVEAYWDHMGLNVDLRNPNDGSPIIEMLAQIVLDPIVSVHRRSIDIVHDQLASQYLPRAGRKVLAEISDNYWTLDGNDTNLFNHQLMDFLTCKSLSRRKIESHPFRVALHESVDLTKLTATQWNRIDLMVHTHKLHSVCAAGYLLGAKKTIPSGLGIYGLPFPEWMDDFSIESKLEWLVQFLEGNDKLQEALVMAFKWRPDLPIPESLVDFISAKFSLPGYRRELAHIVLVHALRHEYKPSENNPKPTQALFRVLDQIHNLNI